jgi:hypothetical protein
LFGHPARIFQMFVVHSFALLTLGKALVTVSVALV